MCLDVKLLKQQFLAEMLHKVFTHAADNKQGVVSLPGKYVAAKQKKNKIETILIKVQR